MNENLRNEFYSTIENNQHIFVEFEKKRVKKLWISIFKYGIPCSIVFASFIWCLLHINPSSKAFGDFVCYTIAVPFVFLALLQNESSAFVREYKKLWMPEILKIFNAQKAENYNWKIITDDVPKSKLFSIYNDSEVDDFFTVTYKNCNFNIAELKLQKYTRRGKSNSVHTCFDGIIICFPYNKTIKNNTIVTTKYDFEILNMDGERIYTHLLLLSAIILGVAYFFIPADFKLFVLIAGIVDIFIYIICLLKNRTPKINKIKLEDPMWEKRFDVYSDDEIEARYHVTTGFMERFLNLKTAFGCRKAKCAFFDDKIMIAISTKKNLFEMGNLFKSCVDLKNKKDFFNEIISIIEMVDYFKFDENTKL